MHPNSLIHIIHLDDYHSDLLVISIICHFSYVPVARKENKEFIRIAIIEASFISLIVIVYNVGAVLAVGGACVMVYDAKAFCSFHDILEVYVVVMAFALSFCQGCVL